MNTLLGVLGGILGAGTLALVVCWIARSLRNQVALDEANEALKVEAARIAAMEKAKDEARARRAEEFEVEKTHVVTASDAIRLLQHAFEHTKAD